ncbi:MAG: 50S ribosomal protein L13 [Bdellovibrionales bacterium]|nr:50S ribosomal protein L13 [Bdellovibrionales bacterium]
MKTFSQTKEDAKASAKWHVVDASGAPLGRLASEVATLIRGKHKPSFTPHVDGGDFVVVINASRVALSGKKMTQKKYYSHSGFPGGIKEIAAGKLLEEKPEMLIEKAVKGMVPRGALGHQIIKKLKVYAGSEHPHDAQKPQAYNLHCMASS